MYEFMNEKMKSLHFTNEERVKKVTIAAEIIIAILKLDKRIPIKYLLYPPNYAVSILSLGKK